MHITYSRILIFYTIQQMEKEEVSLQQPEPFRFSSLFIPHKGYLVTPVLVGITLLLYLGMGISGGNFFEFSIETLLDWGASLQASFASGQYIRLLTSCFIHNGLVHLVMNMPELIFIGFLLEKRIGSQRFLFAYLVTGFISSLISLIFHDNLLSCGASGAILGMYGVFLPILILPGGVEDNKRTMLLILTGILAASNLLGELGPKNAAVEALLQSVGKTDHAAHWGGFLSGAYMGYFYWLKLSDSRKSLKKTCLQWIAPIVMCMLVFSLIFFRIGYRKSSYTDLRLRERVADIEVRANETLGTDENRTPGSIITATENCNRQIDSCIVLLETYLQSPAADSISQQELGIFLKYFRLRYSYNEDYIRYVSNDYALKYANLLEKKLQVLEAFTDYFSEGSVSLEEIEILYNNLPETD